MALVDLKDVTMKIKDGTSPIPNELIIKIGEGNIQWTEAQNMDYKLDKGKLDTVRQGDEVPLEISFDLQWEEITGGSATGAPPSAEDALKQIGNASGWVTSATDICEPYAVDLEIFFDIPCANGVVEDETLTFSDFRWESLAHDVQGAQISVSGKCNILRPAVLKSISV